MLIAMPLLASTPVKAAPVNCEPWSVLQIGKRERVRQIGARGQQQGGNRQAIGNRIAQPVRCFPRVSGRNRSATRQST